jgi:hypothetical protein
LPFAFFLACSLSGAAVCAEDLPDPRPKPALSTYLHIDSNRPLKLRRRVGRFGIDLCDAPCDRTIGYDENDYFVVTGDFVSAMPFSLRAAGPRAELRVDAGSNAMLYTGFTSSAVGGSAVMMGALLLALLTIGDALGDGGGLDDGLVRGLAGTVLGGGVVAVAGIPLIIISQTSVEVLPNPQKTQARGLLTVQF